MAKPESDLKIGQVSPPWIGIDGLDVFDEHSANFASISELVFLRIILQHTGESPEEFAGANLYEVHKHGPKIRMVPERIKMSTN